MSPLVFVQGSIAIGVDKKVRGGRVGSRACGGVALWRVCEEPGGKGAWLYATALLPPVPPRSRVGLIHGLHSPVGDVDDAKIYRNPEIVGPVTVLASIMLPVCGDGEFVDQAAEGRLWRCVPVLGGSVKHCDAQTKMVKP